MVDKVSTEYVANDKAERIMNGVATWCSYYRANPHRFCKDYLNINLKLFQMILIFMMNISNYFMYIASRGQGKSFLVAIFACVRCILYPQTKICIASYNRSQGINVLEKIITELMPNSANLRLEIKGDPVINQANAYINFKNGSRIKVVTANDGARSNRSNIIVVDEFRMVDLDIINKVLRKFNISSRHPKYLDKPEYKHLIERNKELYMSSAWYKSHWSFDKVKAYCAALVDDAKKYFICGLPYELSICEGLLSAEQVADEMSEDDFSEISWEMEMECLWYGESENAFFTYDDLCRARKIKTALYKQSVYGIINDKNYKYIPKKNGEIRIVVADIAVMGGKKNDATAIFILQLTPLDNYQYSRSVIYADALDGGHTETQAINIRKIYDELECDYIVLDTLGVGISIYDNIAKDLVDPDTGVIYPALSCLNDDEMAARCKGTNAPKVIYSVKATSSFNSECALLLRDCLKRGKTKLLISESDAEEQFRKHKFYKDLDSSDKVKILLPYIHTTLLIQEMVNLEHETKNGVIKLKEKSSNRKDRYSSLTYGNYFATILERKLSKPRQKIKSASSLFEFRQPKIRSV